MPAAYLSPVPWTTAAPSCEKPGAGPQNCRNGVLVLRCIQVIQVRSQSSCPALCRVSTESGKACAVSRGWPGQAHGCPVEGNRLSPTIHNHRFPRPGLTRPSTSCWAMVISAVKTWVPGTSPGKGCLQLHCSSRRSIPHCPNCSTGQPWVKPGQDEKLNLPFGSEH
jgi:hypothetical protein